MWYMVMGLSLMCFETWARFHQKLFSHRPSHLHHFLNECWWWPAHRGWLPCFPLSFTWFAETMALWWLIACRSTRGHVYLKCTFVSAWIHPVRSSCKGVFSKPSLWEEAPLMWSKSFGYPVAGLITIPCSTHQFGEGLGYHKDGKFSMLSSLCLNHFITYEYNDPSPWSVNSVEFNFKHYLMYCVRPIMVIR